MAKEKKDKKDVRSRGWIFVVQNWTDDDLIWIHWMFEDDWNATYLVIGFEEGGRARNPHLQCYIYYTNPLRWKEFKDRCVKDCHIEGQKAKKNVEAYCYSMKDGEYIEFGERPRQGHRTDLEVIKHDIEAGRPMKEIAQYYFAQWCQYGKRFDAYIDLIREKYNTSLVIYDRNQAIRCMRLIGSTFRDYLLVSEYLDWLKIAQIVASGRYTYVFIPDFALYNDYRFSIDGVLECYEDNTCDIKYVQDIDGV